MAGFSTALFLMLCLPSLSLKSIKTGLKIGVLKEVKPCRRFIEDGNWVYAHIVARVEGRSAPVVDTYKANKPMHFMVNNTDFIKGFNLGMRGACEGERRRITIPPELAYRGDSVEGLFPPYSTWTVDAEILEVVKEQQL
jgi:FK506-binding protein 2